jgi:hypothetical protein
MEYDNRGFHKFCPKNWRHTHNITGDYVFDASIEHCKNPDMARKLASHVSKEYSYGGRTNYGGYSGMGGDD